MQSREGLGTIYKAEAQSSEGRSWNTAASLELLPGVLCHIHFLYSPRENRDLLHLFLSLRVFGFSCFVEPG